MRLSMSICSCRSISVICLWIVSQDFLNSTIKGLSVITLIYPLVQYFAYYAILYVTNDSILAGNNYVVTIDKYRCFPSNF